MAHIYCGDERRLDPEVFAAVKELPDSYWILAEFDLSRNVDWFIIRASQNREPSLLILTELKRVSQPLEGDINGPWSIWSPERQAWALYDTSEQSMNPYWQAVDTGNALKEWLWNNQSRYLNRSSSFNEREEAFKIWPDLLILSPRGTRHRLPFRPSNGYGRWFYDIDQWIHHIDSWRPKDSNIDLAPDEIEKLAGLLNLTKIWSGGGSAVFSVPEMPSTPSTDDLLRRITALERRVAALERQVSAGGRQSTVEQVAPSSAPPTSPRLRQAGERWGVDLERTMADAIRSTAAQGKLRIFPTIIEEMNLRLGFNLGDRDYLGYGSAPMLFNQAVAEGLIRYGPSQGSSPTVYLADEPLPATAPAAVRAD